MRGQMIINTMGLAERRNSAAYAGRYEEAVQGGAFGQALRTGYASAAGAASGGYHCTLRTGWLYSAGSPVTGQELHMKYDGTSTREDPVMYVEGRDLSGKSFRGRIRLNEIDMDHASLTEIMALRTHLAGQGDSTVRGCGNLSLMALAGQQDVNRKMDFAAWFGELISVSRQEGNLQSAEQYMAELKRYLLFLQRRAI